MERPKMFAQKRSFSDRRSVKDRRRFFSLRRFNHKGPDHKVQQDRRSQLERRVGYVKIGEWSSVKIRDLKLAKYLQPHWSTFFVCLSTIPIDPAYHQAIVAFPLNPIKSSGNASHSFTKCFLTGFPIYHSCSSYVLNLVICFQMISWPRLVWQLWKQG